MTLISEIITDAYRETNLIAAGQTETAAESTEALRLLNRYISALLGNELGAPLETVVFGELNVNPNTVDNELYNGIERWFVPQNHRLVLNISEPKEVFLFPYPDDGCRFAIADGSDNLSTNTFTVKGSGHTIEDQTQIVLNEDGLNRQWFYREDLANWVRVTQLLATDDLPFPEEFVDMFVIGLAMRLVGRQGKSLVQESLVVYSDLMRKFKARYTQTQETPHEEALRYMTGDRRLDNAYSRDGSFEKGIVTW